MYPIQKPVFAAVIFLPLFLTACGGEGADNSTSAPAAPAANAAPSLSSANSDQSATVGTAFSYDGTQSGGTFTDADGDTLTYTVSFSTNATGLNANAGVISGTPTVAETITVTITASDGNGGSASDTFNIVVGAEAGAPNLPAQSFSYSDASVGLPAYYTQGNAPLGNVAGADNTPNNNPITNAGATLGRVLFYDKKLSANDTVACASCHIQEHGFADPRVLSVGFNGGNTGRHSMGLANARYYNRGHFFWDERADTLEDQVLQPIQDSVEMGMTLTQLEAKLMDVSYYPALFEAAFGDDTINSNRISLALAQFVRSMVSTGSKFDSAFPANGGQPDFAAVFTAQELQGLQLFGQATPGDQGLGCVRCHGTSAHISDNIHNNGLDIGTTGDDGAGNQRFKAPSLRNIAVRPPYMHDGRFATLEEVIEFYNSGVQANPNLDNRLRGNNNQPRRLNLTDAEKAALLAFLETLTDNEMLADPRFSDPFSD